MAIEVCGEKYRYVVQARSKQLQDPTPERSMRAKDARKSLLQGQPGKARYQLALSVMDLALSVMDHWYWLATHPLVVPTIRSAFDGLSAWKNYASEKQLSSCTCLHAWDVTCTWLHSAQQVQSACIHHSGMYSRSAWPKTLLLWQNLHRKGIYDRPHVRNMYLVYGTVRIIFSAMKFRCSSMDIQRFDATSGGNGKWFSGKVWTTRLNWEPL